MKTWKGRVKLSKGGRDKDEKHMRKNKKNNYPHIKVNTPLLTDDE